MPLSLLSAGVGVRRDRRRRIRKRLPGGQAFSQRLQPLSVGRQTQLSCRLTDSSEKLEMQIFLWALLFLD